MAEVTRWGAGEAPDEAALRAAFTAEGLRPHAWSNGPHYQYAPHTHDYHKVLYVLRGAIAFDLVARGETLTLGPGDRLDLPAGTVPRRAGRGGRRHLPGGGPRGLSEARG
jgi:uncharacterized protein YjlB